MRSFFFLCCLFSYQTFAQTSPTSRPLQAIICGNGELDAGEECDDGNTLDGDSCSADCAKQTLRPTSTSLPVTTAPIKTERKSIYDTEALINPTVSEGPYYRSPKVAFWLSAAPSIAAFGGLYATLIYRGVTEEEATAALTASLAGASVSPSIGMLYAQKPGLAFGLMAGRAAASGIFSLGLLLNREDVDNEDEFDGKMIGFGMSSLAVMALLEVLSTPNAAKQAHPPGTPKPATIIKQ